MESRSTHFIFDGKKIVISPDLLLTFGFLQEIEKEIESLLVNLAKPLINHAIRSKFIVLFANLETLLRLNFAYENKIDDGEKIRKLTLDQKVWESFYNNFCLSINNQWIHKNRLRLKNITAQDLRYLRNSLTHFFSLDVGLQIADATFDQKSRKLEQDFKVQFISPEDLYDIIKGAAMLMMKKWSDEYLSCLEINSSEFKERIIAVNTLVKNSGAIAVQGE